ncbi:MAG TPA: CsbD family protein [Actinomycetota bacterium]|nr:CsbD family protein [Actinomycetota bacterium]
MDSFGDKVDGKTDQAGGKLKEMAGETFNDPDLAAEGRLDQGKGEFKEAVGDVKDAVGNAKDGLKDSLS